MYYSVLDVTPTTDAWVADYMPVAERLVKKYGGQYLADTMEHEQLEGDKVDVGARVIIVWPTRQAALDFMNDPEYKPHLEARQKGSVSHHYLIKGKDEEA